MTPTKAKEFSNKLEWLNAEPQSLAAHHGRVVLLLFWNASSVYCHNTLANFYQLQRKYPDALSVITLHIPKFPGEMETKILQDAVNRLDVQLPVANDTQWTAWQDYGRTCWPSIVLIDPLGMMVAEFDGDEHYPAIEARILEILESMPRLPVTKPKAMQVKNRVKTFAALQCPSGLVLHNGFLYIADSSQHRILECSTDGKVRRVIGNGLPLFLDGPCAEASFNRPMGMSVAREYLYVADTGNHAVRRVLLLNGAVDSILGNGSPGYSEDKTVTAFQDVQLNNPTAVSVQQGILVIADAGNNCLWMYNQAARAFSHLVGNGTLGLLDGVGQRAQMAHPLGLSGSKNFLYCVEGSNSAVRTVAVPEGRINTVIGHGLYQFGLQDGLRQNASLQHPCAVMADEKRGVVWVADTYNHKIRSINMLTNQLTSIDMQQVLTHPCALALDDESLWIADSTSSHLYRYFFESEYLSRISIQMP